jgi:Carboxypeptidase regulatory-like domain
MPALGGSARLALLRVTIMSMLVRFLLSAAIAAGSLCAQPATVAGVIKGPDGSLVADAVVQASGPSGVAARAISTAKGVYRLGLPAGTYAIAVVVPCCQYYGIQRQGVAVRGGQALSLNLELPWGANLGAEGDDPILLLNEFRQRSSVASGPAPRTSDGKPDLSGIWINVFNPNTPPPPLQPWADQLLKKRMADDSKDYPGAYCLPANAAPITRAFPYKFVQTPKLIVVMHENETPGTRQIFLDGRAHPDMNIAEPTWQGHSIGHWEGDTLVVDTANYNDKAWLSLGGIPHTDKLHTVERIRRVDLGHIDVEITMDDAGAFTGPWKRTFTATLAPADVEILDYICSENNRDVQHYRGN